MNKSLLILCLLMLFFGCGGEEKKFLTPQEREAEEAAIIEVARAYNDASTKRDKHGLVSTLAHDVKFFGTDSSEIIRSLDDFREAMTKQWESYQKIEYGEMHDISIQMDNNATLAYIIFGCPCYIVKDDQEDTLYLRVMRGLKKERGRWLIASGIVGVARISE